VQLSVEAILDAKDADRPHLLPVEVTHAMRRLVSRGEVATRVARQALDLASVLPIQLYPYDGLGRRVWELRNSLPAYDAWYVALAETGAPLATLDQRLTRAAGVRCTFTTPY